MDSGIEKRTWRNSPWTVAIGFPVFVLLILVFVALPCTARRIAKSQRGPMCRTNLRQLAEAKNAWVEAGKKSTNDIPTDAEIFGLGKYLRTKPVCPAGGTYTLGAVGEKPRCSMPGHTI